MELTGKNNSFLLFPQLHLSLKKYIPLQNSTIVFPAYYVDGFAAWKISTSNSKDILHTNMLPTQVRDLRDEFRSPIITTQKERL